MRAVAGPGDGVVARVAFGEGRWALQEGDDLRFGRASSNDLRLPADQLISREAGVLTADASSVLVRNLSATRPLILRPPTGADRVVEERSARPSEPFRRFQIVIEGSTGELAIEVRLAALQLRAMPGHLLDAPTITAPFTLTPAQRAVVEALCRPLLTTNGRAAAPATYRAIGLALDRSPQYVRNVLASIRTQLAGYGFPGFVGDEGEEGGADYRLALAQHAIRVGWAAPPEAPPR